MTDRIEHELLQRLQTARERAHAPYSGFRVAAAVETAGGVFVGCNVETAHYKSICAEASALSAMVAAGEARPERVVILAPGDEPCPPCGDCRQRLREFAEASTPVLLIDGDGRIRQRYELGELLPHAFGGEFLDTR